MSGNTNDNEREQMPKLPNKRAKVVEETESTGFSLLENGRYRARLAEVTVKDGKEYPYWNWEFTNLRSLDGEEEFPGRQWAITSLSPKADFKLKEAFVAFGVPANTDTDELIGDEVILVVSTRTIKEGDRKGEQTNTVTSMLPLAEAESGEDGEGEEDEETF